MIGCCTLVFGVCWLCMCFVVRLDSCSSECSWGAVFCVVLGCGEVWSVLQVWFFVICVCVCVSGCVLVCVPVEPQSIVCVCGGVCVCVCVRSFPTSV